MVVRDGEKRVDGCRGNIMDEDLKIRNEAATEYLKIVCCENYNKKFDNFTEHTDSQVDLAVWLIAGFARHFEEQEEIIQDIAALINEKLGREKES
jgi:hypothetical protein